jgi:hypothetical protein
MRQFVMFLLIVALSIGWAFDHAAMQFTQLHLKFRSQSTLQEDDLGRIVLTEHHKPGFMGMQVWQVWRAPSDGTQPIPLMTVEAAFQESQPLQPLIERADGSAVVTDKAKSFAFDINEGAFIENKVPEYVYRGSFRYSLPPINEQ